MWSEAEETINTPLYFMKVVNGKNLTSIQQLKDNDDAKRSYFSSNLHDLAGEVLKD